MSGSNSRRPPLVADNRPAKTKKASAPRKTSRARRKQPARRRSRNPLVWLVSGVFRLIWGIGWRVTALVALAVAGAVLFYAATRPPRTYGFEMIYNFNE